MPELPDIEVYLEALRRRVVGRCFSHFGIHTIFALRTVSPKKEELLGVPITAVERLGKRIVLLFEGDRWMVIHLMVSGRLRWLAPDAKPPAKISHASWRFEDGLLVLTEASSKKMAGIWLGEGSGNLALHDPGGLDPLSMSLGQFSAQLVQENRTLKRALTNPRWFAGIGNAYSDEILHAARLSPLRLTQALSDEEIERLHVAIQTTLVNWRAKLLDQFKGGEKFPGAGEVTAFRPDFATHGKFGQPCPVCGKPIQRIVYAENETNYCAVCQNEGRVLADRSLSRLLKDDWPRRLDED